MFVCVSTMQIYHCVLATDLYILFYSSFIEKPELCQGNYECKLGNMCGTF